MKLDDIRKNINEIDDKMKTLFDARMGCATEVAKVKIETGDSIYKPVREKEMYERFMDDPDYVAFLKKVVQISRRRQYELFFVDDTKGLKEFVTSDLKDGKLVSVSSPSLKEYIENEIKDGKLELTLRADRKSEKGLCIKDILSIISASTLDIEKLDVDSEKDTVFVTFNVPKDDISQKEAYLIKYMLESETL